MAAASYGSSAAGGDCVATGYGCAAVLGELVGALCEFEETLCETAPGACRPDAAVVGSPAGGGRAADGRGTHGRTQKDYVAIAKLNSDVRRPLAPQD